ncbi:2'-5' RNA ligase family protein [Microlunatus speluncae]|uniref:2'-5' RNA ligase family protein n=1 Tax=Microlunatus speluncae TaxID=2594267 RepID=UPI0012662EBD|nr:2'-5' RNA ligase family protein [Microlunatus speluncae]
MLSLVVIAPLVPISAGDQFEQGTVPLHLTVLPKFLVPDDRSAAVESMITEIAAVTGPITATSTGDALFGQDGTVEVSTIEASAVLQRLHVRLLEGALRAGAMSDRPAYNGDRYRPHVTRTSDGHSVRSGDSVELTTLAILDCSQPTRRVSFTASLSGTD